MTSSQLVLKLAALCLHYPSSAFVAELVGIREVLPELPAALAGEFAGFLDSLLALPEMEREQRYAKAFDFQKEHALYLTFHEHGESTQRAAALLAVQEQIQAAGFFYDPGELPDYLPMLLELLAEAEVPGLPERVGAALGKIAASLQEREPLWVPVLRAALAVLPYGDGQGLAGQTVEEDKDLPYPMDYR